MACMSPQKLDVTDALQHVRSSETQRSREIAFQCLGNIIAFGVECNLGFQVNSTSKSAIQLSLEFAHFLAQLAQSLLESRHLIIDFLHRSRKALLHLRER